MLIWFQYVYIKPLIIIITKRFLIVIVLYNENLS